MDQEIDPARPKRSSVFMRALIELPGTTTIVERRVRNLSETGACVDNADDLVPGTKCRMQMGCVPALQAEIVWSTGRLAGLRFDRLVSLDAARKPRGAMIEAKAGWMTMIDDPFRR